MKLVTKIKLSFLTITIGMAIQSLITYTGIASIGSELEEISEYQVPLNSLVMDLEKDILKEEVLTYELLLHSKDIHSDKFIALEKKILHIEKETDQKLQEVIIVIDGAIQHSHEPAIKEKYQEIHHIFLKIKAQQSEFELALKELEHDLAMSDTHKAEEHTKAVEHSLHAMDEEIAQIASIMKHLLEQSTHQALEDEHSIIQTVSMVQLFLLIFIIIIATILTTQFKKSISAIENFVDHICTQRDLRKGLHLSSNDEVGIMARNLNKLIDTLRDLIHDAKNSSAENSTISHELSTTALSVGRNVENSVVIIEDATKKAEAIKGEISDAISDAQESKGDILHANDNLEDAKNDIITLSSGVQNTAEAETELAQTMETLASEANEVKSILIVISDIADQTNLLALNAAIEAARAGEHGRGFAVVADEVRKLAERTQKTLTEINSTISVVVQSIGDASTKMGHNAEEIQGLVTLAQNVEDKINNTVTIVDRAVHASDKTVQDFKKTGHNVVVIVEKVEEINSLSATNSRSVEEISAAADHLNSMTEKLNTKLESFGT